MDDTTFWGLIALVRSGASGGDDSAVAPLVKAVSDLPDRDIAGFSDQLARKLPALDGRAGARESGSTIWSGEPDSVAGDAFLYARLAVVAGGHAQYEAVLAEPARMPKDAGFEPLLYVASKAWARKTGLDDDGRLASPV